MMNSPTARLTARDIIAKTFAAKSRRGYDPAEVDAYLMDVARQVDDLNLEIDRLTNEVVRLSFGQATNANSVAGADSFGEIPPPVPPSVAADLTAEEESLKLILKAAQKTAEQTIVDARSRGEEILAEARSRAAEMARESDRKAYESASRVQAELLALEDQINGRRSELDTLERTVESEAGRVRSLAYELLRTVGEEVPVAVGAGDAGDLVLDAEASVEEEPAMADAEADRGVIDLTDESTQPAKRW
jgi:DivIVA domain-containing protein